MDLRPRLLAHRGLWVEDDLAPNSAGALLGALRSGFSIETDIRDFGRNPVISHDPTENSEYPLLDFLLSASELIENEALVALNVKSDGLIPLLSAELEVLRGIRHFFFDMSFPESLKYMREEMSVATRISEYESPALNAGASPLVEAIWVDSFDSDWWNLADLHRFGGLGSKIVIVSPELHGRDPKEVWRIFSGEVSQQPNWYICTDHPREVLELIENA
jgi:hypothetical protein